MTPHHVRDRIFREAFRLRPGRLLYVGMPTGTDPSDLWRPFLRHIQIDIHCHSLYIAPALKDRSRGAFFSPPLEPS